MTNFHFAVPMVRPVTAYWAVSRPGDRTMADTAAAHKVVELG
jgi:hypothetical protein